MARRAAALLKPSRLSATLKSLNRDPRLSLSGLKGLSISLVSRNDHFGARHFIKDELPRIRYANPSIDIAVQKLPKSPPKDSRKSELVLEHRDGRRQAIDVSEKWATEILEDIMNAGGGERWQKYRMEQGPLQPPPAFVRKHRPEPLEPIRPKRGAAAVLP